ncbi:pyridoxal phosphate-dependent aminotransferase [Halomonas ventosae]|uniref:Aminotransferase n=1 Tax=Halomonas ventosae TaxID=229007 RepID=A0A4R6HVV9_9GAMM|nr:pyridoxal phosphate-dependent aminotransferase [Halomonas ventosae]TDO12678.1 aspartate/methionine/tyrosine aminotransferase [Halomonas ventosae]
METISIRDWVFQEAAGRYDIDLGDSNAPCWRVGDLPDTSQVVLDYGADRGTSALREHVAELYGYSPRAIGITHGGQEALYLLYRTLLKPGDHLITFWPGWQQSWLAPERSGCTVTALPYGDGFRMDFVQLVEAIRPTTRAIVVNTPCNPTGKALTATERDILLQLARSRDLYLIADEEYLCDFSESLVHEDPRVISVSGLSKVYGVPGLRIGWLCGDETVVANAIEYKHLTTISNSALCEHLGSTLLARRAHLLEGYKKLLKEGYETLQHWVASCGGRVSIVEPEGTPFCWVRLHVPGSSLEFCRRVLHSTGVLTMPAELFGEKHGMRLTFVRPTAELEEGLARIKSVLLESAGQIA